MGNFDETFRSPESDATTLAGLAFFLVDAAYSPDTRKRVEVQHERLLQIAIE